MDVQTARRTLSRRRDPIPELRSRGNDSGMDDRNAVVAELNAWCREYGWPMTRNTAVAEEALRRAS